MSKHFFKALYADDSNFFEADINIYDLFRSTNTELKNMKWMSISSYQEMLQRRSWWFSGQKKGSRPQIKVMKNGSEVKRVKSIKFLGIILDKTVLKKSHIENIKSRIAKGIAIILKATNLLLSNTLLTLYYSFVYLHLSYILD